MSGVDELSAVKRCPRCGAIPRVGGFPSYYNVVCDDCYDGAPDAGPVEIGSGIGRDAAISDWNDQVDDFEVAPRG